ncbi:MAG: glycosyltransferase family 4 protein [Lewinellaceae bacterium]|nr:glycosyltransferase family 4 protein [Lewinellaceae bacterium]
MNRRFIFLNSHPIQYFAPLYAKLSKEKGVEVQVLYCSDQGLDHQIDRQFNTSVAWDIPILDGYRCRFLKNHASRPSVYSFWGLQNWGIIPFLWKAPKSILVVNGWGYLICLVAIVAGNLSGHTVCLRGESPISREQKKTPRSIGLRKLLLGKMLFRFVHRFLYIGKQNKAFYQFYGVSEKKLVFSPYAVDNERFQGLIPKNADEKKRLRQSLGLPENASIILYSGKYMAKKRPLDLLEAFARLQIPDGHLVMVGEGELRPQMEAFIRERRLNNVRLTGFVNQSEIPRYYAAADIFVMCSDADETWGLSVNEAMNLGLPVIASDEVGCAQDLVRPGENGFTYPVGDIDVLREKIRLLIRDKNGPAQFGRASLEIIRPYSYDVIIQHLKTLEAR